MPSQCAGAVPNSIPEMGQNVLSTLQKISLTPFFLFWISTYTLSARIVDLEENFSDSDSSCLKFYDSDFRSSEKITRL